MTKQINLYQTQPDITQHSGEIIASRHLDGCTKIAVYENIVRASGGGEPHDQGFVQKTDGQKIAIQTVEKSQGLTWLSLLQREQGLHEGEKVTVCINAVHRQNRRKLHTASHILIRTALNYYDSDDVSVSFANISENADTASIGLRIAKPFNKEDLSTIDKAMRSIVLQERPVTITKSKSMEHASNDYNELLRVSDPSILKGRLRLVVIDGYDVNPCSGLHHGNTNIGPYAIFSERDTDEPDITVTLHIQLTPAWHYWFGD